MRTRCEVHQEPSEDSPTVGYLTVPSVINVTDAGNGWVQIDDTVIRHFDTNDFFTNDELNAALESGIYIRKEYVSDEIPAKWLPEGWVREKPEIKTPPPIAAEEQKPVPDGTESLEDVTRRILSFQSPATEEPPEPPEPAASANAELPFMSWTDVSGKYTVEARYKWYANGDVVLEKKDGTTARVPLKRLSDATKDEIRDLLKEVRGKDPGF